MPSAKPSILHYNFKNSVGYKIPLHIPRDVLDSYENLKKIKDYYVVRYYQEFNPGEVAGGFGTIVSPTPPHLNLISLQMDARSLLLCCYLSSELLLRLRDYQMIRKCARP